METDPKRKLLKSVWYVFFAILCVSLVLFLWPTVPDKSFVFDFRGEVTIFGRDGTWESVTKSASLSPGYKLKTATKSMAEIRLNDGSLLRMNENTELEVISVFINPMMGIRNAQWKITSLGQNGGVYVNTGNQGSLYEIQSVNSESRIVDYKAVISAGSMRIFADSKGNSVVKVVEEGSNAILEIGDKKMNIPPGSQALVKDRIGTLEKAERDSIDDENASMDKPRLILNYTSPTLEKSATIKGQTGVKTLVFLNGEKVTESDPNGNFSITIELPVGKVKHEIMAQDNAGRRSNQKIEIERIGKADHILIVSTPKSGITTTSESIAITGSVQGSEKLTINDKPVNFYGSTFSTTIELQMGLNTFYVRSIGKNNDIKEVMIWLTRSIDQPEASLNIYYPTGVIRTKESTVIIKGVTSAKRVKYAGKTIELKTGDFNVTVPLEFGRNAIVISAEDEQHKSTSKTVVVIRDVIEAQKPNVKLMSYPSSTSQSLVNIQGNASNTRKLEFDGKTIDIGENGYFIISMQLTGEGKNSKTLVATSKDNVETTIQINIWKDSTPPDLTRIKATRVIPGKNEVDEGKVVIRGQIEQNCDLFINGTKIKLEGKGDLRTVFHTLRNYHQLTVMLKAVDKLGNESTMEVNIE
jgi:hypothetical protein